MDPPPASRIAGMAALVPRKHTLGVDVHHQVPFLGAGVLHVADAGNAGVVDQYIQLAEAGDRSPYRLLPGRFVGYVEAHEHALAAAFVNGRLSLPALPPPARRR